MSNLNPCRYCGSTDLRWVRPFSDCVLTCFGCGATGDWLFNMDGTRWLWNRNHVNTNK